MGVFIIFCDRCQAHLNTKKSLIGEAVRRARLFGWWIERKSREHPKVNRDALCPDCVHRRQKEDERAARAAKAARQEDDHEGL